MALTPGIITSRLSPQRYRQQPQGTVEIDWAHPLARGLVFFQIPSMQAAHDLVSGNTPAVLGATALDAGLYGRAINTLSASTDGWVTPYKSDLVRSITTDFTIATRVDIAAVTANSKIFCLPLSGTAWTNPYATVQLGRSSSSSQTILGLAPPTGFTQLNAFFPANTFQVSTGNSYVATKSGTTARLLYNKSWLSPASSTLTTDAMRFGTGAEVALMNRMQAAPGEGTAGKMYYAAMWSRALSEAEARDFEANPYQILKPLQQRSTFAFEQETFAGTTIGVLPRFGSLATGQRLLPGILGQSAASLPKFLGLAAAVRAMPARAGAALGSMVRFGTTGTGFVSKMDEFGFEFDDDFQASDDTRTGSSAGITPKFRSTASAIALGPGFASASAATLPKFSALATATRSIPNRVAATVGTLPKFTSTITAARVVDPRTATGSARLSRFGSSGIVLRGSVDRDAQSIATLPRFRSTVAASRTIPANSTTSGSALPKFGTLAAAARTIPARIATSSSGLPRLRSTTNGVSLPPPGTVVPVTVNHRRAPAWRLADAGTGQSSLSFASPLDPNGLTYFTIDWSMELNGSSDTIWLDKDAINVMLTPSSIVAGLMIHAITFDDTSITVWLKIQNDQQNAAQWIAGESYTMNFTIKTMNGQIFSRAVTVTVKQM